MADRDDTRPWEPEHLRLAAGDRVMVSLGGECPGPWSNVLNARMPHSTLLHGLVGEVRDVHPGPCCEKACGHGYAVSFGPWPDDGQFSRSELVRLAAIDPRGGDTQEP